MQASHAPRTAVDQAYSFIKNGIIAFRFRPGDSLSEMHLSELLGISRTPIREALRRLQNEGLVRTVQYKGSFVAPLAIEDLMEIYFIREVLEGAAASLAALRGNTSELTAYEERLLALDPREWSPASVQELIDIDFGFHHWMLRASGYTRLSTIISTLNDQAMRFRHIGVAYRPSQNRDELLGIITALKAGDSHAAETAVKRHIRGATEDIIKAFSSHAGMPGHLRDRFPMTGPVSGNTERLTGKGQVL